MSRRSRFPLGLLGRKGGGSEKKEEEKEIQEKVRYLLFKEKAPGWRGFRGRER